MNNNDSQVKLLPCPFCNGAATFHQHFCSGENIIECLKCTFIAFYNVDWKPHQCISAWNTRHSPQVEAPVAGIPVTGNPMTASSPQVEGEKEAVNPSKICYNKYGVKVIHYSEYQKLEAEIEHLKKENNVLRSQCEIVHAIHADSRLVEENSELKKEVERLKSHWTVGQNAERADCDKALYAIASFFSTPVTGYGVNTSWAISDLCKAIKDLQSTLKAYEERELNHHTLIEEQRVKLEKEKASKDNAYSERNNLVAFLSRLYPSHLCRHSEEDKTWEDDWRWIVCIHSPQGQLTWHLHDSDIYKFRHLVKVEDHWDGHTTEEKYKRLAVLSALEPEDGSEYRKVFGQKIEVFHVAYHNGTIGWYVQGYFTCGIFRTPIEAIRAVMMGGKA